MLKVQNLSKSFSEAILFENLSFVINDGEKVGLVGPNGVGKSTLLKIIAGIESANEGQVITSKGDTVAYLPQQSPQFNQSVEEYIRQSFGETYVLFIKLKALEKKMADSTGANPSILKEYGDTQDRFADTGGWNIQHEIEKIVETLGIGHISLDLTFAQLSGGEQARILMAGVLVKKPTILLLDEPTNHLDIEGTRWLENFLTEYKGALLVVSHDRKFLDQIVKEIFELNGIQDEMQTYTGGYTEYSIEKKNRLEKLAADFEAQEKYRKRLEADIEKTKQQAMNVELSTKNDKARRYAKKVAKKAKTRERRLAMQMKMAGWIAKPETRPKIILKSSAMSNKGALLAKLSDVSFSFDSKPVLTSINLSIRGKDRVVITGRNGSGKTTLIKIIAGILLPTAGEILTTSQVAYLPQDHSSIEPETTLLGYFRRHVAMYEDEARSFLIRLLFDPSQLNQKIKTLSPGERAKLILGIMVNSGSELILLDEPTNHLDFDSLAVIEEMMQEFKGTLVIISHDRYFIENIRPTVTLYVADHLVQSI